jgi:hypothetical protein
LIMGREKEYPLLRGRLTPVILVGAAVGNFSRIGVTRSTHTVATSAIASRKRKGCLNHFS